MSSGRSALKNAVKRFVKRTLAVSGRCFGTKGSGCRILTYHSVGGRAHEMTVSPVAFREQMEWLKANANTVSLAQAVETGAGVAVTFDDGFRDTLTRAAPVLQDLGIPATVFVVSGRAGRMLEGDSDPETCRLMDWEEVRRIETMGFAVGAHSMTHVRLSSLSEAEQRAEIVESARELRAALGHSIEAFAYPFGSRADFDETSKRLVREAGFRYGLSNQYGANGAGADRFAVHRIWIDGTDDLRSFRAKVRGDLDALALLDSRVGAALRRRLNHILNLA